MISQAQGVGLCRSHNFFPDRWRSKAAKDSCKGRRGGEDGLARALSCTPATAHRALGFAIRERRIEALNKHRQTNQTIKLRYRDVEQPRQRVPAFSFSSRHLETQRLVITKARGRFRLAGQEHVD